MITLEIQSYYNGEEKSMDYLSSLLGLMNKLIIYERFLIKIIIAGGFVCVYIKQGQGMLEKNIKNEKGWSSQGQHPRRPNWSARLGARPRSRDIPREK